MAKFQKGQSGNPKGRPKRGDTIAELLRAHLSAPDDDTPTLTRKQVLVARLYQIASFSEDKDSLAAIKIILEYTDGKPTQPITQEGNQTIRVVYDDDPPSTPT